MKGHAALLIENSKQTAMSQAIAITQGDSAGIGPEIIAKAFRAQPQALHGCFVVGELQTLRRATALAALGDQGLVQPIAVKQDGTRVPAIERQCERYLQAPTISPSFTPEQRLALFAHTVEPTLQRELKHKGAANGDGSYSAELIGYVEVLKTPD